MRCTQVKSELPAYLDGELPPATERAVAGHLAGCAACQAELGALRRSLAVLQAVGSEHGGPEIDLWPALRQQLCAQTRKIHCARVQDLLPAYLEGETPPGDGEAIHRHLEICPGCAGEHRALLASLRVLETLPPATPPADLWPALRARLAAPAAPRAPWLRWAWQPVAAAALVASALVGARLLSLRAPEPRPGPRIARTPRVDRPGAVRARERQTGPSPKRVSLLGKPERQRHRPHSRPGAVPIRSIRHAPTVRQPFRRPTVTARPRTAPPRKWTAPDLSPGEPVVLVSLNTAPPLTLEERELVTRSVVAGSEVVDSWRADLESLGRLLTPGSEAKREAP